jgi:hypothetical protein
LTLDLNFEVRRQSVYYRATHTVQTTGDGVSAAAELSTGVEDGENNLYGRLTFGGVNVDGDTAAVVNDADAAVFAHEDFDVITVTGERLINRVVDDLIDQVVKTTGTGGSDIHTGALANRFKAFKNLNITCAVIGFCGLLFRFC